LERIITDCRVIGAGCEVEQRITTLSGVAVGIASVRCWSNGSTCGQKAKADKRQHNEKGTAP